MQNIKNFKIVKPTAKQIKLYKSADGAAPVFLKSDDNQDWYEAQRLFADDTIKIMYDSAGIVRSVVDKPVPQRGGTYAVSMLFPINMSVAEIAVEDYPTGCTIDGSWQYDGTTIYQDEQTVNSRVYQKNLGTRNKEMSNVAAYAFAIQSSAAVGNSRDGDADNLLTLQQYADALRDVDLTVADPDWPGAPSFL
ncbi:tail fiber assembly protein [Dryocola sp. LX212]